MSRIIRSLLTHPHLSGTHGCSVIWHQIGGISGSASLSRKPRRRSGERNITREVLEMETVEPGYIDAIADIRDKLAMMETATPMGDRLRRETNRAVRHRNKQRIISEKQDALLDGDVNLLTWAAKRQILELAKDAPELWSAETLSACFPATEAQLHRLIHGRARLPTTPHAIYRHDERVLRNLRELAAEGEKPDHAPNPQSLKPGFKWLLDRDQWRLLVHADGNPLLPLPEKQLVEDRLSAAENERRRTAMGPFQALCLQHAAVRRQADAAADASDRLAAEFAANCERQRAEVVQCLEQFDVDSTRRRYAAAGVLPSPSEAPEAPDGAQEDRLRPQETAWFLPDRPEAPERSENTSERPQETSEGPLTMLGAARAARGSPKGREEAPARPVKAAGPEEGGRSRLEALLDGVDAGEALTAPKLELPKARPFQIVSRQKLNLPERAPMQKLHIFRYSFEPAWKEEGEEE